MPRAVNCRVRILHGKSIPVVLYTGFKEQIYRGMGQAWTKLEGCAPDPT